MPYSFSPSSFVKLIATITYFISFSSLLLYSLPFLNRRFIRSEAFLKPEKKNAVSKERNQHLLNVEINFLNIKSFRVFVSVSVSVLHAFTIKCQLSDFFCFCQVLLRLLEICRMIKGRKGKCKRSSMTKQAGYLKVKKVMKFFLLNFYILNAEN